MFVCAMNEASNCPDGEHEKLYGVLALPLLLEPTRRCHASFRPRLPSDGDGHCNAFLEYNRMNLVLKPTVAVSL